MRSTYPLLRYLGRLSNKNYCESKSVLLRTKASEAEMLAFPFPSREAGSRRLHKCPERESRGCAYTHDRAQHLLCRRHRISLARVMLFREMKSRLGCRITGCLNLSCESMCIWQCQATARPHEPNTLNIHFFARKTKKNGPGYFTGTAQPQHTWQTRVRSATNRRCRRRTT